MRLGRWLEIQSHGDGCLEDGEDILGIGANAVVGVSFGEEYGA